MKNAKIHPPYYHTNILHLPHHIIVEIFCKLPTKALIRCRFVCKRWLYFFKDPQFTKELFERTPSTSSCVVGLLAHHSDRRRTQNRKYKGYFLVDFDNSWKRSLNDDVVIKLPEDLKVKYCVEIVGSCNGLLCLHDLGRRFYISNPITGESLLLPEAVKNEKIVIPHVSGFGVSPISNVYKVFFIYTNGGSDHVGEAMVLTLGYSGIWRSVIGRSVYPDRRNQPYMTHLNGRLHWSVPSNDSLLISSFDLETEQFQDLPPLPSERVDSKYMTLGVLGDFLCIMGRNSEKSSNIWVMKDYGAEGSWSKAYVIDGVHSLYSTRVLKYTKEGILLLHYDKLWAYAPGQKDFQRVKVEGMPSVIREACDFTPNFVPLDYIIPG